MFALTYAVLGFGALPRLRLDRTGAALVGATLMLAIGALDMGEAARAVDLGTLALLFGTMVVAAHLRLAGFFRWVAAWLLGGRLSPRALLHALLWASGALAALFVNDTVCVLLTPLVVAVVADAGLPPAPYLLAIALGSNAGSVATVIGNPQNMLVASFGHLAFGGFAAALAPVALGALALTGGVLDLAWGRRLPRAWPARPAPARVRLHRPLLAKTLLVAAALLAALLAGVPPPLAAMGAASALLVTRRVRPGRVRALVDWSLLAMFAGLFVVVAGLERSGLAARLLAALGAPAAGAPGLALRTAALSNLVSNVPAVLLLKGAVAASARPAVGWRVLAMASTLAGNLTLVGSVANLIVIEQAPRAQRPGFLAHARVGVPATLLSLAWGLAWLAWTGR